MFYMYGIGEHFLSKALEVDRSVTEEPLAAVEDCVTAVKSAASRFKSAVANQGFRRMAFLTACGGYRRVGRQRSPIGVPKGPIDRNQNFSGPCTVSMLTQPYTLPGA